MQKLAYILLLSLLGLAACEPYQVADVTLPAEPVARFNFEATPDDANRIVVTDQSDEGFVRLWDFDNGRTSTLATDTVFYPLAGEYTVSLTLSGRGGTARAEQTVVIEEDAALDCDSTSLLLAGGCAPGDSAAWVFSQEAAAIGIGPNELSIAWFSSPPSSLQPEQYDDSWVFAFTGSRHQYYNNGLTVDPAAGFEPVPFDPPTDVNYTLSVGTGYEGTDQIILPAESFIGVKNSGPVYDIIELTEDRMVLLSQQTDGDGWFTQIFVRQ